MSTTTPPPPVAETGTASFAAGSLVLPQHNWKWFLLRGIIAILLGLIAVVFPGFTLVTFTMIFAAFSFADGLLSLIAGIRGATHHTERWGALVFSGITGIAVGVIFFLWPLFATAAYAFLLVTIVALWALVTGIFEIVAAVRLRKSIEGEFGLALAGALSIVLAFVLIALLVASPGATLLSVAWMIGIYLIASGVMLVVLAFRLKRREG